MYPLQHLSLGIVFSLIILFIFPQIGLIGFLIIILSTILIDIDHYIYYIYRKKDWSLKNAYNWSSNTGKKFFLFSKKQKDKFYTGFYFLHGVEIILVCLLLSIISKYFLFISLGFTFHLLLDIYFIGRYHNRVDRVSVIYDFLKFKKLKPL